MKKICVFAGTTEGKDLVNYLSDKPCQVTACVATEYGEISLDKTEAVIKVGRLTQEQMEQLFSTEKYDLLVDATHPFATIVSENIKAACNNTNIPYIRINRDSKVEKGFEDVAGAIEYLKGTDGNILLTTGSKELEKFSVIEGFSHRVYARVLPFEASIAACTKCGLESSHIIGIQGPFTEEMNLAMINFFKIKILVTKNSGDKGGFEQKLSAAQKAGIECVVINPPTQGEGVSYSEGVAQLNRLLNISPKPQITVIGIGTGSEKHMTKEAVSALEKCDAIIGAKRITDACGAFRKPCYNSFLAKDVVQIATEHPEYQKIAVVMSGDIGFYSGAKKLYEGLTEYDIKTICGISTPIYFASKLKISWDDMKLFSLHGRQDNLVHAVKTNRNVFVLVGGDNGVQELCQVLCEYGFGDLTVHIGENLAYENEKITTGKAQQITQNSFSPLSAVIVENPDFTRCQQIGICDEEFARLDKIPMTKAEVRAVSLSKLQLSTNAVVYDIGAGTGSISVECALGAYEGRVYAIEKNEEAAKTIVANKYKFKLQNIELVQGCAPEVMDGLVIPTHAFIGGSSGNLSDIFKALLHKNPNVRIVVNTIALESLAQVLETAKKYGFENPDIVQLSVAKAKKIGGYNMMNGQNPIYIITCQKEVI
ncbi:MAG: precorrin-6A reductase [Oscillospiraceae bacterium]